MNIKLSRKVRQTDYYQTKTIYEVVDVDFNEAINVFDSLDEAVDLMDAMIEDGYNVTIVEMRGL